MIEFNEVWESFRKSGRRAFRDFIVGEFRRENILWALKGVSFKVERSETLGIIGPNGAGKTTILKILAGVIKPDRGTVRVDGKVSNLIELGIGFHPDLSLVENVYLQGAMLGIPRSEISKRLTDIVDFAELGEFMNMPVKYFSSGMFVRLGFSLAIYVDFDILLIDEVLAVGDEHFQQKCIEKMANFKSAGKTILFVSHNMDLVRRICDRAILLKDGSIITEGTPKAVIDEYICSGELEFAPTKRWGSGEIEIMRVRMKNKNGDECCTFKTDDEVEIEMEYRVKRDIKNPVFGVGIARVDGVYVSDFNHLWNKTPQPIEELKANTEGKVVVIIDNLPLLRGNYYLSCFCYNHSHSPQTPIDHLEKVAKFQVTGGEVIIHGLVSIPNRWIIK